MLSGCRAAHLSEGRPKRLQLPAHPAIKDGRVPVVFRVVGHRGVGAEGAGGGWELSEGQLDLWEVRRNEEKRHARGGVVQKSVVAGWQVLAHFHWTAPLPCPDRFHFHGRGQRRFASSPRVDKRMACSRAPEARSTAAGRSAAGLSRAKREESSPWDLHADGPLRGARRPAARDPARSITLGAHHTHERPLVSAVAGPEACGEGGPGVPCSLSHSSHSAHQGPMCT